MVPEAIMICIDDSKWMLERPLIFQAQADAFYLICTAKLQVTDFVEVRLQAGCDLTKVTGTLKANYTEVTGICGDPNLEAGIMAAEMALKPFQNGNQLKILHLVQGKRYTLQQLKTLIFQMATDGSGNFTTITDAINFAPNNSLDRIIIYIKQGLYEEIVEIPSYKTNIVLLGEGNDITIISGNRSMIDGWTTFRSATVAVSGEGFLARDIGFYNMAGAEKNQAVALRINADLAAVYRCVISGYQNTLYVHSFRQFYRECDIYGTIDYVFGNAAVVFQGCNIISRLPMPGQFTVIAAQSRDSPDQQTGISFQNCSILATEDLHSHGNHSLAQSSSSHKGWIHWSREEQGLDTLYYGEYDNIGPGSRVDDRVQWPGHHVMDYSEASNFTVSELITGQEWLDSTSFPYDDSV
ncbi:Pectinesterase, active site-containing protein [Artemisia annua]|uniref:Pectinesterase n=1 Tax=Artemisia annua TaxID=35608 RepID=A0A2U1M717_ARTAN|nr:Pectinesterase, active site-containing protein [Artemisia annua]